MLLSEKHFASTNFNKYILENMGSGFARQSGTLVRPPVNAATLGEYLENFVINYDNARTLKDLIIQRARVASGKWWRPWDMFTISQFLNPDDYWVGVEIETNVASLKDRNEFVEVVATQADSAIMDGEGANYGFEVTFAPENLTNIFDEDKQLHKVFTNGVAKYHRLFINDGCGTHVNISSPVFRNGRGRGSVGSVTNGLVYSVDCNLPLFGRRPYGYIYERGSYIELKLFQSSNVLEHLKWYVHVAKNIMDWVDNGLSSKDVMEQCKLLAKDSPIG